ncbi:MAG: hypothetical protein U5K33_04315 [Halofilum sp. (in: g-proteobacteria)]|nr:hypothetical protein [Halofilum sp. (in: g-proteobacteria)]
MDVKRINFGIAALLLCLVAAPAWADDETLEDVTMEVVEDPDADEAEYVDEIELPAAAAPEARDNAAFGIDTAKEARDRAREDGQAFGQSTASEARELGRDAGNAAKSGDGAGGGPPEDLPVEVP